MQRSVRESMMHLVTYIDEISFQTLGCINFSCWQGQKPIKTKVLIINYKREGLPSSLLFLGNDNQKFFISFSTDELVYLYVF